MDPAILVVSGCSAVGKSTVSALLAGFIDASVHVPGDDFYCWFDDPWPDAATTEGARRYEVVGAAIGAASMQLAIGGYTVILDCPVFPDGADDLARSCAPAGVPVHYALLRADLSVCLARMAQREPDPTWDLDEYEAFHARFGGLEVGEDHVVDATPESGAIAAQVLAAYEAGRLLRTPPVIG